MIDTHEQSAGSSKAMARPVRLWPLHLAVFGHAIGLAMIGSALPFLAKHLGATPTQVGWVGAAMTAFYAAGCLALRPIIDRTSPRLLTALATSIEAVLIAAMAISPKLWVLVAIVGMQGMCMAMFWPPVMGWLSTGVHGQTLNRRLRTFNISWCSAMIVGPALGGVLFELRADIPFYSAAATLLLATGLAMLIVAPDHRSMVSDRSDDSLTDLVADRESSRLRLVAWIGLFFGWMTMGMLRWQIPNLTDHLKISVSVFGVIGTVLSATMTVAFVVLGKSENWHHRRDVHAIGQLIAAVVVVCLCWASSALMILAVVTVAGLCLGQTYARSVYQSAAGAGKKAASRLAIHEITLASGFVLGALGSGWLTEHIGLRAAYPTCAVLLVVGLILQMVVSLRRRKNGGSS